MFFDLPRSIVVDGIDYPILTDFKAGIEWYSVVTGDLLVTDAERALYTVRLFCLEEPEDTFAAFNEIQRFLIGGQEPEDVEPQEPCIDFVQDFWYIWAGFLDQYNLDLQRVNMHWWKFRALLDELRDDTRIKQIMYIRTMPLPDPSKESQKFHEVMELKHKYRIKEADEYRRAV